MQIVSNSSWRTGTGNKYTQQQISDWWTRTDLNGQTYLGDLIHGMNAASQLPGGFAYMQKRPTGFTDWHATIVSGVYDWRMPLAASVIPRGSNRAYWLSSWNIVSNGGHYIELHGYEGLPQHASRWVHYSDPAGTYASSAAANYRQGSYAVWATMTYNGNNMVY